MLARLVEHLGHHTKNLGLRFAEEDELALLYKLGLADELEHNLGAVACPDEAGGVVEADDLR